jgi:peptidyl-prolyl cis-trans isomerase SurA
LNLKDDYAKIQQGALSKKQSEYLNQWISERVNTYYIRIDPEYQDCSQLKGWVNVASSSAK